MENKACRQFPIIPLRGITVFPRMVISFPVGREKSIQALGHATESGEQVFLVAQRDQSVAKPELEDLCAIGTVAKIKQILKLPGNATHVIAEGICRGRLIKLKDEDGFQTGTVVELAQDFVEEPTNHIEAMMKLAVEYLDEYGKLSSSNTGMADAMISAVSAKKPGELADILGGSIDISAEEKQQLHEILNPVERLENVMRTISHENEIRRLKKEIDVKVKVKIDRSQKEYYLNEELKIIQKELGDKDGIEAEVEAFRILLDKKDPPLAVKEAVEKELNRMRKIPITSPESHVSRNYIETVLSLPWTEQTKAKFDISKAEKILNEDHYGLEKIKERILEYLAVYQSAPQSDAPIICLFGPPGVGKTSIARSVARAVNRNYVRMSLGGVKDEAEIRGHRKTYIGAMPGRIINAMIQAKTINPLMLLDEVDKLQAAYNGDPAAALLEVLDAEQNNTFRDHFIELPYDLSKVLFICTANSLDTISKPLIDRMEIINLSSYTWEEKKNIATRYLISKQMKKHGLKTRQFKIEPDALLKIIDGYTKEAGVRQLERTIGALCRKAVKRMLAEQKRSLVVTTDNLESLLGPVKYHPSRIFGEPQVGIVRGLAWTSVGGDTLSIEVNTMKGTGKFELTGNMGKVMKESAQAAMSYLRSREQEFKLPENFYKEQDVHIHIPQGAVPKDGPSAGAAMALAILSAFTEAKIRNDVAMTGEITIRGRVLAIGGLKEKVLAAKVAGVTRVILPLENQKDLEEVPKEVQEDMEFIFAKDMSDVITHSLAEGESVWR